MAVVLAADINGLGVVRALHRHRVQSLAIVRTRNDAVRYSHIPGKTLVTDEEEFPGGALATRLMQLDCGESPVLIATSDVFLEFILAHRDVLQTKFRFLLPSSELLATLLDKRTETRRLALAGVPLPRTENDLHLSPIGWFEGLRFPIIVKPRMAKWVSVLRAKNRILNSCEEARAFTAEMGGRLEYLLAQEVIPGDDDQQWVCNCVFSKSSELISCFTFNRLRLSPAHYGVTAFAISRHNEDIRRIVARIGSELQYAGPAMIEFKRDVRDGEYKYLETNPRLGMCNWFDTCCGVENAFNTYRIACGEHIEPSLQPQRENSVFISLFADLYARRKDGEKLSTIILQYARFLGHQRVGAYWTWSDPCPALVMSLFQVIEVSRALIRKSIRLVSALVGIPVDHNLASATAESKVR